MQSIPSSLRNQLARFARIMFSIMMSVLFATMIGSLLWSDYAQHYTYRLGSPIVGFIFASFIIAFGAFVCSGILFWFDRSMMAKTKPSPRRRAVLIFILTSGVFVGYWNQVVGGTSLICLIYWIMTGRVAGQPGWSVRHFRQTKWDEKLYLVVISCFCVWSASSIIPFSSTLPQQPPGEPPYRVKLERQMTPDVNIALSRFPSVQSCLKTGADADNRAVLIQMDWDKIYTDGDAEVCAFRLMHEWGGINTAADWLEAQGFRVGQHSSSDHPFLLTDGTMRVDGYWSIRTNGPLFPTSGTLRRIFRAGAYGTSFQATYSADGTQLLYMRITHSIL